MVMLKQGLLLGSMVLPQLGSVLMFVVHVAAKGHTDAKVLAATYAHVGAQGLSLHGGHTNLSALLSPRLWCYPSQSCFAGPCLVLWSCSSQVLS